MRTSLAGDGRGIVYAEFLLAFTPLFTLFLGVIQLAFIGATSLVVQNAAMKGARAAMVVLPDDPFFYGGEDAMTLDFHGTSDESKSLGGISNTITDAGVEQPSGGSDTSSGVGGPRLNQIRLATSVPLAPVAPPPELLAAWLPAGLGLAGLANAVGIDLPKLGIHKGAIGTNPAARFFTGLLAYNSMAAAINFPSEPGSPVLRNAGGEFDGTVVYKPHEPVTVRVTYLYPCTVPIVSRLICRAIYAGPDSAVAQIKQYGDAVGDGGKGIRDRLKARAEQVEGYAGDQWKGFRDDAKDAINAPRNAVMEAARCVKAEAVGFKDGLQTDAFALRDGVVGDVNGLRRGIVGDVKGLRDGVLQDARGLVDGTRDDARDLGRGLVTDGKNLVGDVKRDAQGGVRQLETQADELRRGLADTGLDVARGVGDDVSKLGDDLARDGRDALGQVPGLGNYDDITKPADDVARAGRELGKAGEELYGVGKEVYKLADSPYDPFTTAATAQNATNTVGRVVETTDAAGRRVVVGVNDVGQQVVKTFDGAGNQVEQTMTRTGELVVVTMDAAGHRVESTIDKAGNRIDRGVDEAGNRVIVATDKAGKTITTTIDTVGNRVVESVDQAKGRVITTIDTVGNRTVTTIDAAGKRVDAAYTSATTRIETTYDSLGNRTRAAYDGTVKRYESTVDAVDGCTERGYDEVGTLLDDPTQAFRSRAERIIEDAQKLGDRVRNLNWRDELLGTLRPLTPEEAALMTELRAGTKQPDLLDMLLLADNARFYVLRREATLPIQAAKYRYPTFEKFEGKDREERADARD